MPGRGEPRAPADDEARIRELGERVVKEKGYFALHGDESSLLLYDVLFRLQGRLAPPGSFEEFLACFRSMVATSTADEPFGFCTHGFADEFLRAWWGERIASGDIALVGGGFRWVSTSPSPSTSPERE